MARRIQAPTPQEIHQAELKSARDEIAFTPEAKMIMAAEYTIRYAKESLTGWAAEFAKSPHNAFRWAQPMVERAAELDVYQDILRHLKGDECRQCDANTIRDELRSQVMRGAREAFHSTSPLANAAEDARRIAAAKVLETVESVLNRHARAAAILWAEGEPS
jgi:hypothetical protein